MLLRVSGQVDFSSSSILEKRLHDLGLNDDEKMNWRRKQTETAQCVCGHPKQFSG